MDLRPSRKQKTVITVISKLAERQAQAGSCLVVTYGSELGRRYPLEGEDVTLGRSSECDIIIDQDSVSRQHARIAVSSKSALLRDLGSTNGTYVNDQLCDERALNDGDHVKIGRSIFKYLSGPNIEAAYHEEIYRLTTVDGLTQTYNRRYFDEQLTRELLRAARYSRPLSIALFDVDRFARINDEFGHLAGDAVLAQLSALLRSKTRCGDVLARTAEEEFGFILPETDLKHARSFAEKVRRLVEATSFTFEETAISCTISLGLGSAVGESASVAVGDFVKAAHDNLGVAKRLGRNRVAG